MARENIDAELQEFRDRETAKRAARRSQGGMFSSGTGVQSLPSVTLTGQIAVGSTISMTNCTMKFGSDLGRGEAKYHG